MKGFIKAVNQTKKVCGIGLALSKKIVEENGGYITVKSKVGEGTKFIVRY